MPKGFHSKGYNPGGSISTTSCLECGKRFRGRNSKVNKSMLLHTKYNHPEHLQETSKELKIKSNPTGCDLLRTIGKYGADEHNKSSKEQYLKGVLEYHLSTKE